MMTRASIPDLFAEEIRSLPDAITPRFSGEHHEPLPIHDGAFALVDASGERHEGAGRIWLEWLPQPRVRFNWLPDSGGRVEVTSCELSLPDSPRAAEALLAMGPSPDDGSYFGVLNGPLELGSLDAVESVVTHHVNLLLDYTGRRCRNSAGDAALFGRLEIVHDELSIQIDRLEGYETKTEQLRASGGWVVTHAGCITSSTGRPFERDEMEDALEMLHLALTFARGAWTYPFVCIGLDAEGEQQWQRWCVSRADPWVSGVYSWANGLGSGIHAAMRKVMALLASTQAEGARRAIAWYADANRNPVAESTIVQAQVCLELLSWETAVEAKAALSRDGHRKLAAADCIRVSLALRGIPASIPPRLGHVTAYAQQENLADGPEVLTSVRNAIVHPTGRGRQRLARLTREVLEEVRGLALQYIELLLLAAAGYRYDFADRHANWAVKSVPWAS